MMLRASQAVLMLALAAWLAALVTGGLSAAIVFGHLPRTPLTLEQFASWPAAEHGALAAGIVMAKVFSAVDRVQLVAAPLALSALAAQHAMLRVPLRNPSAAVRATCATAAAALLAAHAVAVRPQMSAHLGDFWSAAESGDRAAADLARGRFDRLHGAASTILRIECVLVAAGIAASAVAFTPASKEPA